jgi:3-dehydroquinate dehydratase/shikimate dehydrogenase
LGCQEIGWENRGAQFADVLVNCTPVGMHPNVNESPFQPQWLDDNTLVFDTVYNPENTLLIKQARERGCPTVSGIEMFIRQAALQHELFTDQIAPLDVMREALRRGISAIR